MNEIKEKKYNALEAATFVYTHMTQPKSIRTIGTPREISDLVKIFDGLEIKYDWSQNKKDDFTSSEIATMIIGKGSRSELVRKICVPEIINRCLKYFLTPKGAQVYVKYLNKYMYEYLASLPEKEKKD